MSGEHRPPDTADVDGWLQFCADLAEAGRHVFQAAQGSPEAPSPQDVTRHLLWSLAFASLAAAQLDADHPDWIPLMNSGSRAGNPSPDNVYYLTRIRAPEYYRVGGVRGTTAFVYLSLHKGYLGLTADSGEAYRTTSLEDLDIGPDGTFEILIGPARPDGHTGNFIPTDTLFEDTFVLLRQVSLSPDEVDGRFYIERCRRSAVPVAENLGARLPDVPAYLERFGRAMSGYVDAHRPDKSSANHITDLSAGLGTSPIMKTQTYLGGHLQIGDDEALLMEVMVPASCTYWSVQLMDSFHNALDFTFTQSGLNSNTAEIDPDGRLRIVVSRTDPQIPNWLDKGTYTANLIRWRWIGVGRAPGVTTTLISAGELEEHLFPGVRRISAEERDTRLQHRARNQQLRRRW
jgi:hypothetical protein